MFVDIYLEEKIQRFKCKVVDLIFPQSEFRLHSGNSPLAPFDICFLFSNAEIMSEH